MKPSSGGQKNIQGPSSPVTTKSGIGTPSKGPNQIVSPTSGVSGKPCPKPGQGNQIVSPTKGK